MNRILIIQTAFTGDVVLATALLEKLHASRPDLRIDLLVRKGNEGLFHNHPYVNRLIVWDKKSRKIKNLIRIIRDLRSLRYDYLVNLQRFASSGIICLFSRARHIAGFRKNPFSFCFNIRAPHVLSAPGTADPVHEISRNQQLIRHLTDPYPAMPALYPAEADRLYIKDLQAQPYICIAPASVWCTKQFHEAGWVSLIRRLPRSYLVYLLGGKGDHPLGERIRESGGQENIINLCGSLSMLQSAALMQHAVMNYVNDSAPLHFCSAMDAPVTAVFCSTVPAFGFGPLRENGRVVELTRYLECRPCGLHGHTSCPEGHFRCAGEITNEQLLWWTSKQI